MVLDRVAVIAGTHVIKASDIDRAIRLTDFLNREPLKITPATKHEAAERLITQDIIRQEIISGAYQRPPEAEGAALKVNCNATDSAIPAAHHEELQKYGLTESELRERLLWQTTVLQFINQRFRVGVVVTDEDIRNYYDQHAAELRKQQPSAVALEALAPKIKEVIEGERINKSFDEWLDQTRHGYRVEYKQEAFQ